MVDFILHTVETAPEESKARLEQAMNSLGFIPGLWAIQAESPALLGGYQTLAEYFEETNLSPTERQVILMTANFEHDCSYCMAAHSAIAKSQGVQREVIEALREDTALPSPRLEALRAFTRAVIAGRGWVDEAETEAFLEAGFGPQQILEVILGIALKTMSNYTNHFAQTPTDKAFKDFTWQKPMAAAAE